MGERKWPALVLGAAVGSAVGFAMGRRRALARRARHPVLAGAPLLIAHRGGAELAPENTLVAFRQAEEMWGADMIELDVHATADGHCVVIHDPTVDRTTNGTGEVAAMTLEELRQLDAGYHFTPDGGGTYPFRGQGVTIPTIDEVLEALPRMRFTVEVKTGAAQRPLFDAIRRHRAEHRVIAAGAYNRDRTLFDAYPGPTSASLEEMRAFYVAHRLGLGFAWPLGGEVVQMPEVWGDRRILTPRLVDDIQAHGLDVHVWTVNDPDDMHRLLDWGVDGIMTDRPDLLADILTEREGRPPAPARRGQGVAVE